MAEQSSRLTMERGRTRDATATGLSTAWLQWTKEHVIVEQGRQGGVQQPGAHTGSGPKLTAQWQDYPDFEQQQDL